MNHKNYSQAVLSVKGSSIRELFKMLSIPDFISLAGGAPDPQAFPVEIIRKHISDILKFESKQVLQYGITGGYQSTIEALQGYIYNTRGIKIEASRISITSGAQNAIDAVAKVFLDAGDVVITESPTFLAAITAFKLRGAKIVQVKMQSDGMDLIELESMLKKHSPKLLYIIPNHQNPTGISTSSSKREHIVRLAQEHAVTIIEDDPYFELSYSDNVPRIETIYSMLPDSTVYIGSMSKVIAPGIRLGYTISDELTKEKIDIVRQVNEVHPVNISQKLVEKMIGTGEIYEISERNRNLYREKLDLAMDIIATSFPEDVEYITPTGGMFIWITLPTRIKFRDLNQRLLEQKVGVVPGEGFYSDESTESNSFRINFTLVPKDKLEKGLRTIASTLAGYSPS